MRIYWLNINVKFQEPVELEEEDGVTTYEKMYGYLQSIGATFPDEESLKAAITGLVYESEFIDPANAEIVYESIRKIPPKRVQKEIYKNKNIAHLLRSEPTNEGIWFRTGRCFYLDDDGSVSST